jgi:hypothetical protein
VRDVGLEKGFGGGREGGRGEGLMVVREVVEEEDEVGIGEGGCEAREAMVVDVDEVMRLDNGGESSGVAMEVD